MFRLNRVDPSYQLLDQAARRVTAGAKTPYDATVALEAWLRSNPAFKYTQHPRPAIAMPDLVWFVTEGREGYCQHYAGAMALMLRYLGIPARVSAGFTTGKYAREQDVDGDRPRRAHLGRGLLPGLRLAAVRPDAVARDAERVVHLRLGDVRRGGRGHPRDREALRAEGFKGSGSRFGFRPEAGLQGIQADVPRKGGGG